jgi:outer membrane protein OmpA-like peptidoglycan-associated protein
MAIDLLSLARGHLTPEVVGKLASFLGESPSATQRAVDGAIPAILAGVVKGASTEGGAAALLRTIQQGGHDGSILGNLGGVLGGGTATQNLASSGTGLLNTLLGGSVGTIASTLAASSGVRGSSITTLLGLAAPIVMGVLGKQVAAQGLNAGSLMSLLLSQKDTLSRFLPAGLGSLADLGAGSTAASASTAASPAADAAGGAKWLWPLLIALAIAFGLYYFLRSGEEPAVEPAHEAGPPAQQPGGTAGEGVAAVNEAEAGPKVAKVALPGGVSLDLEEGTINYELAKFLAGNEPLPKTFVFDHLDFDSGSAKITADSRATIENLAAILKAYGGAEARLEGHTDNQGTATSNKKLSVDRAHAVKDALVAAGIAAKRMAAEGYGADKPIASNDTAEDRARNRRTELVVVKR